MMRYVDKTYRMVLALIVLLALGALEANAQGLASGGQLPLADKALPQVGGGTATLSSLTGSTATVVIFWSDQCPWTKRYAERLTRLEQAFGGRGIGFVLIDSGGSSEGEAAHYGIPYLLDEGGALARAFGAERTPHVFVFDAQNTLVYAGAVDDSPANSSNVQEAYLQNVLGALVSGQPVPVAQTDAFGCMITP